MGPKLTAQSCWKKNKGKGDLSISKKTGPLLVFVELILKCMTHKMLRANFLL